MSEFEKALRRKILSLIPDSSIVGRVTKVDESKFTCNVMPLDNDAELFKVRLKPTIDNVKKGIIAIPAVDSYVIIGFLKNKDTAPFVIWSSNFEKYYMVGEGGNTLEFKDDGTILINGDTYGGLIKIDNQVTKLNQLVTELQAQLVLIAAGISAGGGSYSPGTLSQFNKTDFENTKIKHGGGN